MIQNQLLSQKQFETKTWTDAQNQQFIMLLEDIYRIINTLSYQVFMFLEHFNSFANALENTMLLQGDSEQSDGEQYNAPTQTFSGEPRVE